MIYVFLQIFQMKKYLFSLSQILLIRKSEEKKQTEFYLFLVILAWRKSRKERENQGKAFFEILPENAVDDSGQARTTDFLLFS